MNQSIAFIVHLPGKPERRAELESKLLYVLDQMSKEPDLSTRICTARSKILTPLFSMRTGPAASSISGTTISKLPTGANTRRCWPIC